MKNNSYDLVVAGAGPSGITVAITFKKNNPDARILVFDKEKFPRYKVGEVILPGAFDILKILDLLEPMKEAGFVRKIGAYYYWGNRKDIGFLMPSSKLEKSQDGIYTNLWPDLYSYHVDRYIYDNILINEAKKRGIDIIDGVSVVETNFIDDDTIDSIKIDDFLVKGKFYVSATGIYSGIIPNSIKKIVNYNFTGDICYHGYLKGAKFINVYPGLPNHTATTVGSYGNQCWFWYIPISDDLVSVGMVFKSKDNPDFIKEKNKESLLLEILNSKPEVKDAIKDSSFISHRGLDKIIIEKNWNGSASKLYGKNWILVGDAALFADPILSSGVTIAHRTGFYVGMLLNQYFSTENLKFKELLLQTYREYCDECYFQFRDVIKFWYDGMDQGFDISSFFMAGRNNIKKFGIIDQNDHNASFFYLVNGLLQTVSGTSDNVSVNFDQDDYEILIEGLTGVKSFVDYTDIVDTDVYKINIEFLLRKKLRFNGKAFVLQEHISMENKYESAFFISGNLASFIQKIDGIKSIGDVFTSIYELQDNMVLVSNLKKDIKKMILLDLLIKVA